MRILFAELTHDRLQNLSRLPIYQSVSQSGKPGFHSNATQAIAFEWKPGFSQPMAVVICDLPTLLSSPSARRQLTETAVSLLMVPSFGTACHVTRGQLTYP